MAPATPAPPAAKTGVTILLPFRDAETTLAECLDSIAVQTFTAYELLAIDDHSSDLSASLVRQRATSDPRIRVISNPGKGLVAALNFGLEQARHPFIARMDADDRMLPQRLEMQRANLTDHPELSVLGTQVRLFPEEAITAGAREYLRWQNLCVTPQQIATNIYMEAPLAHPSVMLRRADVLAIGGYREGPFPEDYDLWFRVHHSGGLMAKVPHILLHWRERPDRTSRTDPRYSREAFDRLRASYLSKDPLLTRRFERVVIWGAGRRTRKRVRHLLDQGIEPLAWIDVDPRKIGNRINGARIHPPGWLEEQTPKPLVLCYVARHGARERIAAYLDMLDYAAGTDYLMIG